jgi:Trk K+ transport system NAD-binding subunit
VEKNAKLPHLDEHATIGSAADLEVLERAGIRAASTAFVTTHDDDLNIYLTIYCRRLRPDIQIISRATLDRNVSIMHTAGADLVMSHASLVATTVLNLLTPGMVLMLTEGLNLFRTPLPPSLAGKTLAASGIRPETGCNVVGMRTAGGMALNPGPESLLEAGSELVLIGDSDSEKRFLERYGAAGGARTAPH